MSDNIKRDKYHWFGFFYSPSVGLPKATTIISKQVSVLADDPCTLNRELEIHYGIDAPFDETAYRTFSENDGLHWNSGDGLVGDETYATIVYTGKTHDGKGMTIIVKKHRLSYFQQFGETYDCE